MYYVFRSVELDTLVNKRMVAITDAINQGGMKQRQIQMEAEKLAQKYGNQLPDTVAARLDKEWEEVTRTQISALKNGIAENKDNLIPVYFILNYDKVLPPEFLESFLADYKYKDNVLLESVLRAMAGEKRKQEGTMFTDFEVNDLQGVARHLSDYIGKGNYVLIDFWASWCGPCRKEMPNVKEIYEKYHAKGFEIVGISLDNSKEAWQKAVEEMGMAWPQLSDLKAWKSEVARLYNITAIPATILFNPEGKVVSVNLRGDALKQKLAEIYK